MAPCTPLTGEARSAAKQTPKWSRTPCEASRRTNKNVPKDLCAWPLAKPENLRSAPVIVWACLCSVRLGATIVRFAMPRRHQLYSFCFSHFLCPLHSRGCPVTKQFHLRASSRLRASQRILDQSPSTLYHEARQRTAAASPDKSSKTSGPALQSSRMQSHSHACRAASVDDAVAYYVSNYAAKDLLFPPSSSS